MLAQQLENEERGVPFIQVEHAGLDPEGALGAHAADAEDHFLANAGGLVTAIEAVCDVAI